MRSCFVGDSYDLVKRFLCEEIQALGYRITLYPMYTGPWTGAEKRKYRQLLGITTMSPDAASAAFYDPDTGVHRRSTPAHLSMAQVAKATTEHTLVVSYDQSFSRGCDISHLHSKLNHMRQLGCSAMYYDSHARFLFASRSAQPLKSLRLRLATSGIPSRRLVRSAPNKAIDRARER